MYSDPRHPTVLIVDDDADTRELYLMMLESVGYRVLSANSVRAAGQMLARETPQVVITDWRLPDGSGFDVSDALHARGALRLVPIIAVTGMTMQPEMSAEAERRGFTAILLKPASPDDILRAVRTSADIGTARRLRAAAVRLRRYGQLIARRQRDGKMEVDAAALLRRAAKRVGGDITLMLVDDSAHYVAAAGGGTRDLTGYDPEELLSLSVWDLTPQPEAAADRGLWSSFIAAGTLEGRYQIRRRDGVPVEAQYCAIANVIPGLHVSAIAEASQLPASL
jgi:CheY-like chemotaxis protein